MVFCIKFLILVSSNNFYNNLLFFLYTSKIKSKNFEFQEGNRAKFAPIAKTGVGDPSAAAKRLFKPGRGMAKRSLHISLPLPAFAVALSPSLSRRCSLPHPVRTTTEPWSLPPSSLLAP